MTSTEHSIWLMPAGAVRQELASLIARLATAHGAPLFPPHVTLIGKLAEPEAVLIGKTRQVAARLAAYELQLGTVDYIDEYFRSLFVHIGETEPVLRANAVAREVFERYSDPSYMPHLSLLYGEFSSELKDAIIAEIGRTLSRKFLATSLFLYSTQGTTREWYCVEEFPLGVAAT